MKRLTTHKISSEMDVFELAFNACYLQNGKTRYRDYDIDADARELTRKLIRLYADVDDFPLSDDELDDWAMEAPQYGTGRIEGLITLFYRNLWAMAVMREKLMEYEDTGLTPKQIKEIDSLYKTKCKELAERKARQQDNALNLPCKIGQEVYIVSLNRTGYTTGEVVSIKIGAHGASLRIYVPSDKQYINRAVEQIGQSVFFDHAAAEKISTGRNKGADKAVTNDAIVIGGKEYDKKRLCLDWFTMSNDSFFQTYGFNFNPHEYAGLYEWGRAKILNMQAFREGI